MARETSSTRSRRKTASTNTTSRRTRSKKRAAPARPARRATLAPASAASAFTAAFREYWNAVQAQQAAVLTKTQEAYATFMQTLQAVWDEEPAKARFAEQCLAFVDSVRHGISTRDIEGVEAAYREYVEHLRDAWSESDLQRRIEEVYHLMSEDIQRLNEASQQALDEARRSYLASLHGIWKHVAPEQLDAETLATVSRNMMVTVFFTEGMRPADAVMPVSPFT